MDGEGTADSFHTGLALVTTLHLFLPTRNRATNRASEVAHLHWPRLRNEEETSQLIPVLAGLWVFYLARAELPTAQELAEQCLHVAQRQQNPAILMRVRLLGITLFWRGEFTSARAPLEQGIALSDCQPQCSLAASHFGIDCVCYAAFILWSLGYPDQALKRSREALTLAGELPNSLSAPAKNILATALTYTAAFHQFRRERHAAQKLAEAALALSREQGFPLWLAVVTVYRGLGLAEQGQVEQGIAQMCQGLAAHQATGQELSRSYLLALLATALVRLDSRRKG